MGTNVVEQRHDDGRTGDHEDRAQQERNRKRKAENEIRTECRGRPGNGNSDCDEILDRLPDCAQFV